MSTRRSDHAERRLKRRNNSVAKHRAETAHVEGSGTACTCNANPAGWLSPVMTLGLIGAPVMASYSPTVPEPLLATKRLLPKIARPFGPLRSRDEGWVEKGSRGGVPFRHSCGAAL